MSESTTDRERALRALRGLLESGRDEVMLDAAVQLLAWTVDPAPPENPREVEAWHEFMATTGRCEGCGEWVPLDELVDNRHPVPLDDGDVDFCGPVYHPTLERGASA